MTTPHLPHGVTEDTMLHVDIDGRRASWSARDGFAGDEGVCAALRRALMYGGEVRVGPGLHYTLIPDTPETPASMADVTAVMLAISGRARVTPGAVVDMVLMMAGNEGPDDEDVVY